MYSVRFNGQSVFQHDDLVTAVQFACSLHRSSNVPHEIQVALVFDSGLYDLKLTFKLDSNDD